MNFVLHFHLAARDLGSLEAGVGAMLPDLWRIADRRARARREVRGAGDVLAGIEHHLEADAWFHESPVFASGELRASTLLHASALTARHGALFAHILWELCLDGALIRREGFATILDRIRAGITATPALALERAVDAHHFERLSGPASRVDRERFLDRSRRVLDEVARGPWIEGYQSGSGVADRVQGIRRAVGLSPMDASDLSRLSTAADELIDEAGPRLSELEGSSMGNPEGGFPKPLRVRQGS